MLQFPAFMKQYPASTSKTPSSVLLPSQWPHTQSDEILLDMEEADFEEKCNEIRKTNSNLIVIGKMTVDNDKEDFDNDADDDDADNPEESEDFLVFHSTTYSDLGSIPCFHDASFAVSEPIALSSNLQGEALATRVRLLLGIEEYIYNLMVESDCQFLISLLERLCLPP
ncbi:hypothetical protein NE237_007606 [Protea cynaroides]|uniref:Uncharacterized protein n=1 Tax=Protea cynaroides TaxID=273540 RepID=A0A9Q0KPP6_9MAGN|nr:hypothetical protein NE237_007606 [Protea cynaroides]